MFDLDDGRIQHKARTGWIVWSVSVAAAFAVGGTYVEARTQIAGMSVQVTNLTQLIAGYEYRDPKTGEIRQVAPRVAAASDLTELRRSIPKRIRRELKEAKASCPRFVRQGATEGLCTFALASTTEGFDE